MVGSANGLGTRCVVNGDYYIYRSMLLYYIDAEFDFRSRLM